MAPVSAVLLAGYLERLGYSRDLQQHYVRSGWLTRVGRGAFVRAHERPTWQGALYALQTQAALPVHVGGPTALAIAGRAHYVKLGDGGAIDLFAPTGTRLPPWFLAGDWPVVPRLARTDMLSAGEGIVSNSGNGLPLRVSSAERAMLEALYMVPAAVTPTEARELMEGLVDLRPKVVADLLRACRSVRVKRLFLMLAERAGHPWLRRVDLAGVDLGRGKRSVAGGGVYVPAHRLAVPPEMVSGDGAAAGEGG